MGPKKISARRNQVSIQAGPFTITPTESEKLLGGHLHQSLQWNHHIRDHKNSIMKQLTSRINGLLPEIPLSTPDSWLPMGL
jgi:hypothetical protein